MPVPLRLTLRQVRPTSLLRRRIQDRVDALKKFHPRLLSGRVAVEVPHRHHANGNRFHVRIELKVPGRLIVVSHEPRIADTGPDEAAPRVTKAAEADVVYRDLDVALHEAFEAARRRLQEVWRKQNGKARAVRARVPRRRA